MNPETVIQNRIRLALSAMGYRMFRNNVGAYKKGAHWVQYGVCNPGGSDLIGWLPAEIDGRRVAIFVAVEVKVPGKKPTDEQQNFLDEVSKAGGIAFWATSAEEAEEKAAWTNES